MYEERALYNLTCSPVKGFKGDKLATTAWCTWSIRNKRIVWNKWRKWDVLEEELAKLRTFSQHDDAVDSMVLTMGGLLRRGNLQLDYNSDSFDL